MGKKEENTEVEEIPKTKKRSFWFKVFVFILIVALVLVSVKAYFYIKFLVGNDLVLKLGASESEINLSHGESSEVDFEISGVSGPFCKISCESYFLDVTNNKTIETDNFELITELSKTKTFVLTNSKFGNGQDIYRFGVSCHNNKDTLCDTDEESTTRTKLIVVNRELNEDEKKSKEDLKKEIEFRMNELEEMKYEFSYFDNLSRVYNYSIITYPLFKEKILESEINLNRTVDLWEGQNYYLINESLSEFEISDYFDEFNKSVHLNIPEHNILSDGIISMGNSLNLLENMSFNSTDLTEVEKIFDTFNKNVIKFNSAMNISEKKEVANVIANISYSEFLNRTYGSETLQKTNLSLNLNVKKISFNVPVQNFNLSLFEPSDKCCVFGDCGECSQENYPILFIHGHDFNKGVSAEYSLNAFAKLQKALESDGYLSGGELSLGEEVPVVKSNWPIAVRGSYYFDFFKESGTLISVQTKTEGIDTYAIRLKELVENLKVETGQDKVIIVAHSMGGLVARRYVQVFGGEDVDKIILVGTPNKGIEGSIKKYCSILGSQQECEDMDAEGYFIKKLNDGKAYVPTYILVGVGCLTDGEESDGIALKRNVMLDEAQNYFVNGSCSGTNLLHGEMLDPEKYPEFYSKLKEILKK